MISLQNITKKFFQGTGNEVHALKNVTLTIPNGQFVILLGSNGSGKSTLLNCIGGAILPDDGKIIVDNADIAGFPEHKRSKWISRVFQNPLSGTASDLSIVENFRLASIRTEKKTLHVGINDSFRKQVKEQIEQLNLGLENKIDQPMGGLSGGQRQALTLLMAVIDETKVLLLDEPASALDPRTSELIMGLADKLIRQYKLTAVLVTHNLKDAVLYGDRVIVMESGNISHDISNPEKGNLSVPDLFNLF